MELPPRVLRPTPPGVASRLRAESPAHLFASTIRVDPVRGAVTDPLMPWPGRFRRGYIRALSQVAAKLRNRIGQCTAHRAAPHRRNRHGEPADGLFTTGRA